MNKNIHKTEEEWKEILTPEQFRVMREKGTEAAGCSLLNLNKEEGEYHCAACDNLLFKSVTKFESGTGWPSFTKPASKTSVEYKEDNSMGMKRTEVLCWRCGGHLGHVFNDLPNKKRYCMNGVALKFVKGGKKE